MIITRSPLRISLGGGGTDLPSYYSHHGGFLIAAAINKYVYVTANRPFQQEIILKYSDVEKVVKVEDIKHPIFRNSLEELNLKSPQIEITTNADLPSGTGLGSSGSFTTALLKTLYTHYKIGIHQKELAELACKIEIEKLKEPIGKQDQYISAFGGIKEFTFEKNGEVKVQPLQISMKTLHDLEDNLLLFFTGISRSASAILRDQDEKTKVSDNKMLSNLHLIKELGYQSRTALLSGNTTEYANLLNQHWELKSQRSLGMTNPEIGKAYSQAMKNGAVGGKLVGAGGGGFLLFYASDLEKLRFAMTKINLQEVRFQFDFEGTKVIHS
jgi:D-glycero-alpha-D-manno-heptose-7-phosphate kinase